MFRGERTVLAEVQRLSTISKPMMRKIKRHFWGEGDRFPLGNDHVALGLDRQDWE
jgi:hypothetical protein